MYKYYLASFARENEKISITQSVHIEGFLPDHNHDCFEVAYISSGMGYHILNGNKSMVNKGDLLFISYNSYHNFKPITEDFKWINCMFLPELIDSSLINAHNAEDVLKLALFTDMFEFDTINLADVQLYSALDEFDSLFADMLREYNAAKTGYQAILRYDLFILLIRIFRTASKSQSNHSDTLNNNTLVDMVLSFLKTNSFNEEISLETIAKEAYVSPKYFSRLFKKKTGLNLTQFVNKLRVDKACELLKTTDLPISDIMNRVGYKDSKFFYQMFKRTMNVTPGDYRRELQSTSLLQSKE